MFGFLAGLARDEQYYICQCQVEYIQYIAFTPTSKVLTLMAIRQARDHSNLK